MINLSGKVYLQYYNNIPVTKNVYDLQMGFEGRGFEIVPVNIDVKKFASFDIDNSILSEFRKEDILCGGFPIYRKVAKKIGLPDLQFDSYPEILKPFLKREVSVSTINELYISLETEFAPIFVKPKSHTKLFTGVPVKRRLDLLKIPENIKDDTEIYLSEIINFISEYRVYVDQDNLNFSNGIVDCKCYNGNCLTFPDVNVIKKVVKFYNANGAPRVYGIDFGVVETPQGQETILVEVNGGLYLGSYGVNPYLYSQMMEHAWIDLLSHI